MHPGLLSLSHLSVSTQRKLGEWRGTSRNTLACNRGFAVRADVWLRTSLTDISADVEAVAHWHSVSDQALLQINIRVIWLYRHFQSVQCVRVTRVTCLYSWLKRGLYATTLSVCLFLCCLGRGAAIPRVSQVFFPREELSSVKFTLAVGAYSWLLWTRHVTCYTACSLVLYWNVCCCV